MNVASYVGHGRLRAVIMGDDFKRQATPAEVQHMSALLDGEMAAGALGLSSGLEYDPGIYSATDEIVALARVAARHGGRYISHVLELRSDLFLSALLRSEPRCHPERSAPQARLARDLLLGIYSTQ